MALRLRRFYALRESGEMAALAEGHDADDRLRFRNEAVSRWSVGEQLDHLVKVNQGILDLLEGALQTGGLPPPKEPVPPLNLAGRFVLFTGFIPRGAGKSPKPYLPVQPSAADLRAGIARSAERLRALEPRLGDLARAPGKFRHPRFGGLSAAQWLSCYDIHQHHHLKIIRDIHKARRGNT